MYHDFETEARLKTLQTRRRHRILSLVACLAAVIIAFVVGYLVRRSTHEHCPDTFIKQKEIKKEELKGTINENEELEKLYHKVAEMVSRDKLKENLRYFAKKPHMASLPRNNELAQTIKERFESYGFETSTPSYHVLLSLPPLDGRKNQATLLAKNGTTIYRTNYTQGVHPFMAYSPNGTVEGEIVYANYGREKDFEDLEKKGVNCTGKIVIVRYNRISWSEKVNEAHRHGAVGVLLYPDPAEYTPGVAPHQVLPRDGIKRGTVIMALGDPLTQGYAAKEWVFRKKVEGVNFVKIPCQPISSEDALMIMQGMDGPEESDWKGGLNITYRISGSNKVRLEVYNKLELRKITNVIGTIPGNVEPDRWVMMGNHRDAWVNGAVDASSGTSVMMEMARCLAQKLKTGWRPRRTIKFMSWDGEEFALHGSIEYVEENKHLLRERGVIYINLDMAVETNNTLKFAGSPIYKDLAFEASKKVQYFDKVNTTVYEKMVELDPHSNKTHEPNFKPLHGGSDFVPFYLFGGVACLDFGYIDYFNYSMYHTQYDRIDYMENYIDPGYWAHESVAKVALHIILRASNRAVVQFTTNYVAVVMEQGVSDVRADFESFIHFWEKWNLTSSNDRLRRVLRVTKLIDYLSKAVNGFKDASLKFEAFLNSTNNRSELKTRILNDIGKGLERTFYKDEGMEGDSSRKNYIFALSTKVKGRQIFPVVFEALENLVTWRRPAVKDLRTLEKELTMAALIVEESATFINVGIQHLNSMQ